MKLLCDENIPLDVSKSIESKSIKVTNVCVDYKGFKDEEVYKMASKNKCCIITSDHHFDKYRHRKHYGIIRLSGNLKEIGKSLKRVLLEYKSSMENTYIKVTNEGYRIETNKHAKKRKREFCSFK